MRRNATATCWQRGARSPWISVVAVWLGVAWAWLSATPASPRMEEVSNPYTSRVDLRMGRGFFRARCTACHGMDGRGGADAAGPDLTGSLRHASTEAGIFRVIRDGVEGTSMRGLGVDREQMAWQIASYLGTLRRGLPRAEVPGSVPAGEGLYASLGCGRCHMVHGSGGRLGPDLSSIGLLRAPDELRQDLVEPSADVDPRWWTLQVTEGDGTVTSGLRMGEDTFTVRLMDDSERLRSFVRADVRSVERLTESTMSGYGSLSETSLDDLVAYLYSLRGDE